MNINENMFCDFRQPSIVIKNTLTVLKKKKGWGKGPPGFPQPINTILQQLAFCSAITLYRVWKVFPWPRAAHRADREQSSAHGSTAAPALSPFKLF